MSEIICPKCNAAMEEGFLVDQSYGSVTESEWASGKAERSAWTSSVKLRGRDRLPVRTFRCIGCGYLESYAGAPE